MIEFSCSKCGCDLEASNQQAGAKVSCPDCGHKMTVPAPRTARKDPGVTASKPQPKAPPPKKTAPTVPPKRRPRDEDEDYDEEPAPKQKQKGSSKAPLIIGVSLGGGVLLLLLVVVGFLLLRSDPEAKQQTVEVTNRPPAPQGQQGVFPNLPNVNPQPAPNPQPLDPNAKPAIPPATGGGSSVKVTTTTGQQVYKRLLKSTVLILHPAIRPDGQVALAIGSGSLVDKTNRLVLTNYHVVGKNDQLAVFFPVYKDGKMITEMQYFLQQQQRDPKAGYLGRVVKKDMKVDLALLQLDRLPDDVEALPLANARATQAQPVYSVGHPGASGGLWLYTEGKVRTPMHKTWQASGGPGTEVISCDADVVLTDSPTNPGDSGGPLVNSQAEIVAVVHGNDNNSRLMSIFIDVSEVEKFLNAYAQESRTKLAVKRGSDLPSLDTGNLADLIRGLDDKDVKTRTDAAEALAAMGPKAKLAVPNLMRALKDADPLVRRLAEQALAKIGPPEKQDLPDLLAAIKDPDQRIRLYAIETAGKMGADARPAIPVLIEAVKDADLIVKQAALRALGKLGVASRDAALKALVEALKDPDREVRLAAGEALVNVGPLTGSDVPQLQELLNAKEPEGRAAAALSLAKMKADAKPALKNLVAVIHDADPQVRRAVVEALANLGPDAKPALQPLTKALLDSDKGVKRFAIEALGRIGPDAKDSVPVLADALKDLDLRKSAITALGGIGPAAAKEAAPPLAELVSRDTNKENRLLALTTLAALKPSGPEAKAVATSLVLMLQEKDSELRDKAVEALGKTGKAGVPSLVTALNDRDNAWVRLGAANALGEMGPDARGAVQYLTVHAQGDAAAEVRQACNRALARIQR